MGKVNKAHGNMYEWVTHTWSPGKGCPHQCKYCYVKYMRFSTGQPEKYQPQYPFPALGSGRVIFVGHMTDLFACDMKQEHVEEVLDHCGKYPNRYVFQTKNPQRLYRSIPTAKFVVENIECVGTTIETDDYDLLKSVCGGTISSPEERSDAMRMLATMNVKTFITIEPVIKFNPERLAYLIINAMPDFVNIGADSKRNNLPEPSREDIHELLRLLDGRVEIRNKSNLDRLLNS